MKYRYSSYNISLKQLFVEKTELNPSKEVKALNKTELVNAVVESTQLSKKDAAKAVDSVFTAIADALKDGSKVQLIVFVNF